MKSFGLQWADVCMSPLQPRNCKASPAIGQTQNRASRDSETDRLTGYGNLLDLFQIYNVRVSNARILSNIILRIVIRRLQLCSYLESRPRGSGEV
jgi:hypothetical protein